MALARAETVDFASRTTDEFISVFRMLGQMPQSGRLRIDLDLVPDLRSFPVGDYIIYYRK